MLTIKSGKTFKIMAYWSELTFKWEGDVEINVTEVPTVNSNFIYPISCFQQIYALFVWFQSNAHKKNASQILCHIYVAPENHKICVLA